MKLKKLFGKKNKKDKSNQSDQDTETISSDPKDGDTSKSPVNSEIVSTPKHGAGLTGIDTQPVSFALDAKVQNILKQDYVALLNKSATDESAYQKVKTIITKSDIFRGMATYHNPKIANEVLTDILGLGVIDRLLKIHPSITDLGYNGRFLTYKTNDHKYRYGQQPGEDARILTPKYVNRLITKFSYNDQTDSSINSSNPILNAMYGHLRVSVDDSSMTPKGVGPTFSLRVSLPKLALNYNNFANNSPMFMYRVLNVLMKAHCNILISGITGSGKTELQKMLVGFIQPDEKIIMIEDTPETHLPVIYPDKDILTWETSPRISLADHVANSLRNDADWVMVSETRGGEAYQMFQSVKTGHHITTTMHAANNATVPSRFIGMCEQAHGVDVNPDSLKNDFVDFMNIGIHTDSKKIGKHLYRYIDEVAEFVPYSYSKNGIHPLFRQFLENRNGTPVRHWQTFEPSKYIKDVIRRTLDADFQMPHEHEMEAKTINVKVKTTKNKVIKDSNGHKDKVNVPVTVTVPKKVTVHKDHVSVLHLKKDN